MTKNYYGTAVGRNKITMRLSIIKVDVKAIFFFFSSNTPLKTVNSKGLWWDA
jgi:hypothetical protein